MSGSMTSPLVGEVARSAGEGYLSIHEQAVCRFFTLTPAPLPSKERGKNHDALCSFASSFVEEG